MIDKPIIPTTEEVLSTMEAELYKARCIVLTEENGQEPRHPILFRIDSIVSVSVVAEYDGQNQARIKTADGRLFDVTESLPEVLTRIARVEKDR